MNFTEYETALETIEEEQSILDISKDEEFESYCCRYNTANDIPYDDIIEH